MGLNHVVRKWSEATDPNANLLITVPGGADGPGGVLVCTENWIIYKNQGVPERRAPIPRREGYDPKRPLLIVSYATHKQKVQRGGGGESWIEFVAHICLGSLFLLGPI